VTAIDVRVQTTPSRTARAQQLSAAFDVPLRDRQTLEWHGDLPLHERPWNVGLIVGPSGSGKTTILRDTFGPSLKLGWRGDAVIDDFPPELSIEELTSVCSAVGFNTIPAWLRPFDVLSTGEQFRVSLARTLIESASDAPIVVDEFTSVVDRQVAKIGAHAAQRWARKHERQLVAATCHYDVVDWLQPDWVLEPASMTFAWRCLQPRPGVECVIAKAPYDSWQRFARFHYLTAELNHAAQCFVLYAQGTPAAFCGVLHRPHARNRRIKGVSRLVTLPDWQGLGLAFALVDRVAAAYCAEGYDVHTYPAHPALIRSFDRSPMWQLRHRPATFVTAKGPRSMQHTSSWRQGARPNAVFRYCGEPLERALARRLLGDTSSKRTRTREPASA
jgi:GNAT superfamily N-acetyltransferase